MPAVSLSASELSVCRDFIDLFIHVMQWSVSEQRGSYIIDPFIRVMQWSVSKQRGSYIIYSRLPVCPFARLSRAQSVCLEFADRFGGGCQCVARCCTLSNLVVLWRHSISSLSFLAT